MMEPNWLAFEGATWRSVGYWAWTLNARDDGTVLGRLYWQGPDIVLAHANGHALIFDAQWQFQKIADHATAPMGEDTLRWATKRVDAALALVVENARSGSVSWHLLWDALRYLDEVERNGPPSYTVEMPDAPATGPGVPAVGPQPFGRPFAGTRVKGFVTLDGEVYPVDDDYIPDSGASEQPDSVLPEDRARAPAIRQVTRASEFQGFIVQTQGSTAKGIVSWDRGEYQLWVIGTSRPVPFTLPVDEPPGSYGLPDEVLAWVRGVLSVYTTEVV